MLSIIRDDVDEATIGQFMAFAHRAPPQLSMTPTLAADFIGRTELLKNHYGAPQPPNYKRQHAARSSSRHSRQHVREAPGRIGHPSPPATTPRVFIDLQGVPRNSETARLISLQSFEIARLRAANEHLTQQLSDAMDKVDAMRADAGQLAGRLDAWHALARCDHGRDGTCSGVHRRHCIGAESEAEAVEAEEVAAEPAEARELRELRKKLKEMELLRANEQIRMASWRRRRGRLTPGEAELAKAGPGVAVTSRPGVAITSGRQVAAARQKGAKEQQAAEARAAAEESVALQTLSSSTATPELEPQQPDRPPRRSGRHALAPYRSRWRPLYRVDG